MALDSLAAIASLVLAPLGMGPDSMPGALKLAQPHYHFDYDGPILRTVRVEKLKVTPGSCMLWANALVSSPESPWQPDPTSTQALQTAWEPWTKNDREAIDKCDDFPCKVKFDEKEVDQMKATSEKGRLAKFYELVRSRATNYLSTGLRPAYEGSAPVDLWAKMDADGFKSALARPSTPSLLIRKLNFDPDQMLTLHMILDRRIALQANGDLVEAAVWVRDAYVDHYFDGWAEASLLVCDAKEQELFIVQMVMSEMDLLKNRGFFAHALFPKYRGAFESNGKPYLDREFTRIERLSQPVK